MAVFFADDFHAVIRWQHLLQPDPYAKPKHSSERAVSDGGSKLDRDLDNSVRTWHSEGRRGSNVDVREVDDGQLTQ